MNLKIPLAKKAQVKIPAPTANDYWDQMLSRQRAMQFSPEQLAIIEIQQRQKAEEHQRRIDQESAALAELLENK